MCISTFWLSSRSPNSFVILLIHSGFFFVILSWLPYFSPKSFGFSCIRLLVCFHVISPHLLVEFSFVVLECPVLSVFFTLSLYLFNLLSFSCTFWIISSSCIVMFLCVAIPFLSFHVPASFLCFIILACFRRFFNLHFQSNFPSWFLFFLRAF